MIKYLTKTDPAMQAPSDANSHWCKHPGVPAFAVLYPSSYIKSTLFATVMTPFVEIDSVSKTFGGTIALDGVTLTLAQGEVHALMGENGAGKSTLGKILAGIHSPDRGTLRVGGQTMHFASPRDARGAGIGMVHQELACCPDLSVAENLALGKYPRHCKVFVDHAAMKNNAARLLSDIGASIDVLDAMRYLSVAQHQLVQIAGAVGSGARILIFDEPTSALSETDAERLFTLINRLRDRGVTIIYVSHRMAEVVALCDRISVLRDGRMVGTLKKTEATQDAVVGMMIGRQIKEYFPAHLNTPVGLEILRVEHLSSPKRFHDMSFTVGAGEIVGLAGLVGAGRSELAEALFGLDPLARGTITLDGREITRASIRERMNAGLGFVPEDRKRFGLALILSCRLNFSLTLLGMLSNAGFLRRRLENFLLAKYFGELGIKTASFDSEAGSLSGGNQQKIVLAKWLARSSRVLLLDEPTRGVDVGAKAAIHALIDSLAGTGKGILLISSELPEILHLSTRIMVMREGRIVGELQRAEASQEKLLRMMSGLLAEAT
jgi:ABC-type sugar transport system ATPase subunit